MTHRVLREAMTAWRIGDPQGQFPVWSDGGARLRGGRWHLSGDTVIYAAEHYSTALLERLAHFQDRLPDNQYYIKITIPIETSYEVFADHQAPNWRQRDPQDSARFGHEWVSQKRSAVLLVPSVVAPMERNLVFNTSHPDFRGIKPGLEIPVYWDNRLFPA